MGDTEMLEQQLPEDSQVNLADTAFQQQQPSNPTEDQNANETIADETLTMPTDVDMTDTPHLPDAPPADASPAEPPEKKSNGDAAPLLSTPKSEPERVEKPRSWLLDPEMVEADEAGTLEERAAFMKELESFYKDRSLEFKPPKFYGEPLNCLKLWRAVIKLGGYDVVTASKLWRQVGESFNPPKTCTTVSWTFRIFYEKALLEYEKYKRENGEIQLPASPLPHASGEKESSGFLPGSGRARRDAAARAMQGWHAQRSVGYGEVTEPIIKDKISSPTLKRERHLKNIGLQKQKTPINMESGHESDKQLVTEIVDAGTPADWVKINVRETKDCFEVYALVPGLLREEVRVQSDPAGRLVITGEPEHVDNPWGISPFKKVVTLPARIDPLQTSAVVSLHGRLFVRVPFEQGSM
ncbi:AT-rich interactive domain-containing protein 5-like [Hibiscus syriacus]|uniref:AT-rich interactive domain-containing protein 5-like n=1 Tax=Hibiscus syriacus TaxID=106335 RepID=UPI0019245FD8|nr:AT-rich interactive domain-containing protein 5-like [Hibiscus syriacus]XP_039055483.1 AT-rich interactive domain-containing protein 5-like [Hibiscus syriacus]XP_039055484.1 AT-rich interactive domain-containing protein 5-like [Hibiscus syriacus]